MGRAVLVVAQKKRAILGKLNRVGEFDVERCLSLSKRSRPDGQRGGK